MRPLCIELFCGKFGWSRGWLKAGGQVVGFDIEHLPHHGKVPSGAELVLQDVLTLHGSQFRNASAIFASPPCQKYSYLAMPWSRSKDPNNSKAAKALRKEWETNGPDNRLFDACFRIQREAIFARMRVCPTCWPHLEKHLVRGTAFPQACPRCYIPLIVENVRGAQPWVGPAKANFGSFYLWGDIAQVGKRIVRADAGFGASGLIGFHSKGTKPVPNRGWTAGCAISLGLESYNGGAKVPGFRFDGSGRSFQTAAVEATGQKHNPDGTNHPAGSWFRIADSSQGDRGMKGKGGMWFGPVDKRGDPRAAELNADGTRTMPDGTKIGGDWFSDPKSTCRKHGSRSQARKAASAQIAMIPPALSDYVAEMFWPPDLPAAAAFQPPCPREDCAADERHALAQGSRLRTAEQTPAYLLAMGENDALLEADEIARNVPNNPNMG